MRAGQKPRLGRITFPSKRKAHLCDMEGPKAGTLLSTLPEGLGIGQVERRVKSCGQWQRQNIAQPQLINLYNSHMGGVDLGDQRIAICCRFMKGNIWYHKIYFHMLEVAVLNAHIMFRRAGHPRVTLVKFKENLVRELIGGNSFRRNNFSGGNVAVQDVRFDRQQFHHPVATDTHRNCKIHIQRVETVYECSVCQVRMCSGPCFERYHTLHSYLFDDPSRKVPRDSKMVVADQEMVQADHFKRDEDDLMFPLIKTLIYLARFMVDSSEH